MGIDDAPKTLTFPVGLEATGNRPARPTAD